jgi:RNA polymerase sigma-70 factor, ECF subfamily
MRERLPRNDDVHYVTLCQRGDVDAFRILVERHQKKMLNVAYRMIGEYEEACEVVQEAFLSAYRAIGKFRGDALFSTWLTGITMNHARNHLRQLRIRRSREKTLLNDPVETDSGAAGYEVPSREPSPIERLEREETQARIQACIDALEEEQREVLVLRDIQGFSYDEIQGMLVIPEGTIKSRLFRAREAVKNCLKKVIGDQL